MARQPTQEEIDNLPGDCEIGKYVVRRCRCPHNLQYGEMQGKAQCSKARHKFYQGVYKDRGIEKMKNHLMYSVYHKLPASEAETQIDLYTFEKHEMAEQEWWQFKWQEDAEREKHLATVGTAPAADDGADDGGDPNALLLGGPETRVDGPARLPKQKPKAKPTPPAHPPAGHGGSSASHDRSSASHGGGTGSQHVDATRGPRNRRHDDYDDDDGGDGDAVRSREVVRHRRRDDASHGAMEVVRHRRRHHDDDGQPMGKMTRREGDIVIRRGEAQMLLDNVRRSIRNVSQCEQLCLTAAKAFRSECAALEEGETLLTELLDPDGASAQTGFELRIRSARRS